MASGVGRAEQVAGPGERDPLRRPDEPLVAEDRRGGQLHHRLVHGAQLMPADHLGDGGELLGGERRGNAAFTRRVPHHLGPPGALRFVQRGVGLQVQLLAVRRQGGHRRHAGRERDRLVAELAQDGLERAHEQPARDHPGALGIGVRKEDGELVATDAEGSVGTADRELEQPPEAGEHLVAGSVPMGVVHGLEAVEVDEDEREWHLVALRRLGQPIELLLEGPMVAELRERILEGLGDGDLVRDLELFA